MKKVTATLIFSTGLNENGKMYYSVRLFYAMRSDKQISILVDYTTRANLAYKYYNREEMFKSMHDILALNNFRTDNFGIGQYAFDGIISLEIDETSYISEPRRYRKFLP